MLLSEDGRATLADLAASQRLAGATSGATSGAGGDGDASGDTDLMAAMLHQVYTAPEQLRRGDGATPAAGRRDGLAADMYRCVPRAGAVAAARLPGDTGVPCGVALLHPRALLPSPSPLLPHLPRASRSLGVLLAELATGKPCTQRGGWRMPRAPSECPHLVTQLIVACVSPDPKARPSAQQALQALLLAGDGGGW